MGTTLTVQDLFKLILFLLGIGVLAYLILIFKKVYELLSKVNVLFTNNEKNLNKTIGHLPEITESVNAITKTANTTLKDLGPEVNSLITNVNGISSKLGSITDSVENTTHMVSETIELVSDSVTETAFAFQHNVKNIDSYIKIIMDVFEAIKSYLKKK